MARNSFAEKSTKDKVVFIVTLVLIIGLIGAVVGLSISLSRSESGRVGGEAYSVGVISAETGDIDSTKTTAIYTRREIGIAGLRCEIKEDAGITYQLFYYDKDGKYLSASATLSEDFDGKSIPEGASTFRVMITPEADDDGKVTLMEVLGYAAQLTVIVSK